MFGELREQARGQRDVARLHDDAGGACERLDDWQQRVGGEGRGFVGVGVDDFRTHESSKLSRVMQNAKGKMQTAILPSILHFEFCILN